MLRPRASIARARRRRRRAPCGRRAACAGRWPSTTWASVTVGSLAAAAVGGGPGSAPALCGPTVSVPSATLAIEPPPAPMVTMSTIGSGSGHSPTWPCWVSAIAAVLDQADVGAGAADIDGDDVLDAARRGDVARADHAGGRARQRRQRRRAADGGAAGDAAVGLHVAGAAPRPSRRPGAPPAATRRSRRPASPAALSTVASERSYSRTTGSTSDEAVTATPGSAARRSSATRRSCAGLAKECSRQTATASTPSVRQACGRGLHARLVERLDHHAAGADALA